MTDTLNITETSQGAGWVTEQGAGFATSFKVDEKLTEEQTPFQTIEIYRTSQFGNIMLIDGFVMLTALDNFLYHEMMSHPVLYCHPAPRDVVIVGGGDCGTLREVLRHACVRQVAQVEIDERVTRLAEQYFPTLCEANQDARAQFYFEDAIEWMARAPDASADVIIVDSTDPVGPAEGLFNQAFYANCARVLRAPGVLIHQSESPLFNQPLLKAMHQAMHAGGLTRRHTLYFPQPCYPSGWWSGTLAGKGDIDVTAFREQAARSDNLPTQYYSPAIHHGALATPPMLQALLSASGTV